MDFIINFKDINIKDVPKVGGKNASLGEMIATLANKGIAVPHGFAITADAYRYFLKANNLDEKMAATLEGLNTRNIFNLQSRGKKIRQMILDGEMPKDLEDAILRAYADLSKEYKMENADVAVRSSATAEDLPGASFAGQQETYLNVVGEEDVITAVKKCLASLFTNRAISYRVDKGFDHMKTYLSVGVQKMIRSDLASSGVAFTIDTETGFEDMVIIDGSWGLGEMVVQGAVIPDEFRIFKGTLEKGYDAIISKKLGTKEQALIYGKRGPTEKIKVPTEERSKYVLTDKEVIKLAKWCVEIEKHYEKPMDIEWAKDGRTDELFIIQARPETVQASKNLRVIEDYIMKKTGMVIAKGAAIGSKIASGPARVIMNAKGIKNFKEGEILVTRMTDPDWEPIMKIASAIVTDEGGRTSHAAIVSRELGIPCVVGCGDATEKIKNGDHITIDCSAGSEGFVYEGVCEWDVKKYPVKEFARPKTKIMMNIGSPSEAFKSSFIPNDGVGLAREEFIIASNIGIHPMALIEYDSLDDRKLKKKIDELTVGYEDKTEFYVEKLTEGIAQIAAAFYPKPVIMRFSDFKTNEYATLVGGEQYEPKEPNPMIGWRGASRYYDPAFEKAFGLECKAVKRVREDLGLSNLIVMVPFCRTAEEGQAVVKTMAKHGLKRDGKTGLKIYVMAEIPSNVIEAEAFLEVFDGMSIGSNDLTQLVLGIDRDNGRLGKIADERNPAVIKMISSVIKSARKAGKYIGICGQAPSDYPDFAKFLVGEKIESISLNPDTVIRTTLDILNKEKEKKGKKK